MIAVSSPDLVLENSAATQKVHHKPSVRWCAGTTKPKRYSTTQNSVSIVHSHKHTRLAVDALHLSKIRDEANNEHEQAAMEVAVCKPAYALQGKDYQDRKLHLASSDAKTPYAESSSPDGALAVENQGLFRVPCGYYVNKYTSEPILEYAATKWYIKIPTYHWPINARYQLQVSCLRYVLHQVAT